MGASGGIGQPLSLLLKNSPFITQLNMYDIVKHNPGVAIDVSHIETKALVKAFTGPNQLEDCVKGVDVHIENIYLVQRNFYIYFLIIRLLLYLLAFHVSRA